MPDIIQIIIPAQVLFTMKPGIYHGATQLSIETRLIQISPHVSIVVMRFSIWSVFYTESAPTQMSIFDNIKSSNWLSF